MLISICLKRCIFRKLPYLWPKYKQSVHRIPRVIFGTTLAFSVNAKPDPLDKQEVVESMSNKSLIQNASSVATTSVNQLLVLSAAILIQHHENYRTAIEDVLVLLDHILTFINYESHQEELWTEMVAARAKIDESKKVLFEMQSFMEYVEKLVGAAVEVAYLAGSEFTSTTLCEAFNTSQEKILLEQNKTKDLEAEYQKKQQDFIKIMGEKGKLPESGQ